jgi:hypothetical protein
MLCPRRQVTRFGELLPISECQNATFYGCSDAFRSAPMSRHHGWEYTMEPSADVSTILNRILDTAADNLRVAKILIQLGLDPNNNHLRRTVQSADRNCPGQHHPRQHVRLGWCHPLCCYLTDADNGSAACHEHGRVRILSNLWRAFRKRRYFSI